MNQLAWLLLGWTDSSSLREYVYCLDLWTAWKGFGCSFKYTCFAQTRSKFTTMKNLTRTSLKLQLIKFQSETEIIRSQTVLRLNSGWSGRWWWISCLLDYLSVNTKSFFFFFCSGLMWTILFDFFPPMVALSLTRRAVVRHAEQTGSLQWFTVAHEYVQGKDWRLMMIYGHLGRCSYDFIFPKFVHLQ